MINVGVVVGGGEGFFSFDFLVGVVEEGVVNFYIKVYRIFESFNYFKVFFFIRRKLILFNWFEFCFSCVIKNKFYIVKLFFKVLFLCGFVFRFFIILEIFFEMKMSLWMFFVGVVLELKFILNVVWLIVLYRVIVIFVK